MFTQGLSLDQAPPFGAPYLFFITAPLFGMLAGVLLLVGDPALFSDRGAMPFLGVAHTLFIGFVAMVMMGAMQQMLPVLAGAKFPRPVLNSRIVYGALSVGTLLLAGGFYTADAMVFKAAIILLFAAFGYFVVLSAIALSGVSQRSESVRAFGYAFISLAVAIGFAVAAGLSYAGVIEYRALFAHLHIAWIVLGWVMLLVIGVSFQVVPMFYVAEAYNPFCRTKGVALIFGGLLAFSAAQLLAFVWIAAAALVVVLALVIGYAVVTILRLYRRKRAIKDSNIRFWYLAMGSLIVGIMMWGYGIVGGIEQLVTAGGVVIGIGFAVSLVSAMLYKIVPFLVWFHLTNMGHFGVPTMRELIPERWIRLHLYLHTAAFIMFVAALFVSPLFYNGAGALFMLSNLLFFLNLAKVGKFYMKKRNDPVMDMGAWARQ